VTDSILTKLAVVVKDYSAYFLEELKHFYSNRITSSGNYNYSIIEEEVQGGRFVYRMSYIVYREDKRNRESE